MPAGTYTYTMYTISGTGNGTFTVTGSFTVTVYDSDDNFGVGDDQLAGNGTSETGAAPVIQSLGAGAPADWNVGDSFYFGGSRGIESGSAADDYLIPKVAGAWQTTKVLFSLPDASTPLVVGQTYTQSGASGNVESEVLPCFVEGTYILTPTGEVPVETLRTGDLVETLDHGPQVIRWIGSTTRDAQGVFAPILFRTGVLGNHRPLRVSPQHRMLVTGWQAELLFGEEQVLVPAKAFLSDGSATYQRGGQVTYFHLVFDRHEIVFSDGAPSESYHPHARTVGDLDEETRRELLMLFPDLFDGVGGAYGRDARMSVKMFEAMALLDGGAFARH